MTKHNRHFIPGGSGIRSAVRNAFQHVWLIAWRQGKPAKIEGRIVKADGSLLGIQMLEGGVSAAAENFDLSYDSINFTYLLAFETAAGLQVQLFAGNLAKKGPPTVVEAGVSGTLPRLAYDPNGTTLARPTNVAFGGPQNEFLYVANLGRWHINRVNLGIKGQALVNQIAGRHEEPRWHSSGLRSTLTGIF